MFVLFPYSTVKFVSMTFSTEEPMTNLRPSIMVIVQIGYHVVIVWRRYLAHADRHTIHHNVDRQANIFFKLGNFNKDIFVATNNGNDDRLT